MTIHKKQFIMLWVLVDSRIGNSNQAIALAEELSEELSETYVIKHVHYNKISLLFPNILLKKVGWHINFATSSNLTFSNCPLPKYIISVGKRLGLVALYLKDQLSYVKLIHIMIPPCNPKLFDLIITPKHDNFTSSYNNHINTIGALHNIQSRLIKCRSDTAWLNVMPLNFIGILIGGNSKHYTFSAKSALKLIEIMKKISQQLPLFISFSPRSGKPLKDLINKHFNIKPHLIYDPLNNKTSNPYLTIISHAKFLLVTADSISMCCEAAGTGKPFYIFFPDDFLKNKHKRFCTSLVKEGKARFIDNNLQSLQEYNYKPLNEISIVVDYIKTFLA